MGPLNTAFLALFVIDGGPTIRSRCLGVGPDASTASAERTLEIILGRR